MRVRFADHDADGAGFFVDDFAALDLIPFPAEGIHAGGRTMHSIRRLLRHLHFREDVARRRIPTRKVDACRFTYEAASTVAPDEILRLQRLTVGERDIHTGVVLDKAHDFAAVENWHLEFGDPAGEDALDVLLPQRESVVVARREVADVQAGDGEARDLRGLS